MANEVTDAFKAAWSYGPSSNPDQPDKGVIHGVGQVIDNKFAAVDESIEGIASFASSGAQWVAPVALATTGNVTLSGEQTIDGTLTSASRVLVKSQSTPSQNGPYLTGPGAWTRTTDADTAAEMLGLAVSVNGGTVNGGKSFICKAIAPITIGTTALPFVEMLNQSAFTNAVNALGEDIGSVDSRYDGVLAPVSQQQTIGPASPASGTGGSASAYALAKEADFAGTVRTATLYASVAAVVQIAVFSRSTSDVFTRVRYVDVSTVVGLNEAVVNLPIEKGQYVGIVTPTNGAVDYIANTHRGFFNGTLTGGAFTDTSVSTGNELQLKFVIDQLEQPQAGALFTDTKTLEQIVGTSSPVSGAGTSAGTIVIAPDLPADAIADYVEWYSNVSASVVVGIYERVGLTLTRVETLGRVTTYPAGLTRFIINRVLKKGQLIGLQSPTAGFMVSNPGAGAGYYYGVTTSADTFTAPGLSTTFIMQIKIVVRREAKQAHTLDFAATDKMLMVGPSYQNAHYNPLGKNPESKASLFSDFNFENYSYSGHTLSELLNDRLRIDVVTGYAPTHPKKMGLAYAFIMEGYNSFNEGVTFTDYQEDARQIVETVKSMGLIPVLCSEWKPVYNASAHAVYKALAEELGVLYVDFIPHTLRMFDGTVNGEFTQDPTAIQHPGVRTNALIADPLERFVKSLGRPANSMKLFRKRGTITVTDIDDDLMFRDNYERAERFKEIYLNQVSLSAATEKYYDELTSSAGLYNQNFITQSEYLLLQAGGTISLGDYALLDIIIDATQKNVDRFELKLSDPNVHVYVKDAFQSPYGVDGKSVCLWTEITGSAGVFAIDHADLPGKMHFDKLTFLLYKSGGITISEPKVKWWGEAGKPAYPIPIRPAATGAELLNVTKFTSISGNKATGWAGVDGAGAPITITPSGVTTYQLPYDITYFITADPTKKVVQTLNYAVDNFDDIEVEIRVTARYFPAVFASSGTYPSGAPINQESFDWRKVVVELIDPTGAFVFTQSGKIGLWWDEVVFRAILPMRVNPLDIRVSGSAQIELGKVSVKRV